MFRLLLKNTLGRKRAPTVYLLSKRAQSHKEPLDCGPPKHQGLVLGMYYDHTDPFSIARLTESAERFNNAVHGRLMQLLQLSGPPPKRGAVRIFYGIDPEFSAVAVVGLGKDCAGFDVAERMDEGKENIRIAAASACRALQDIRVKRISVESMGHSESAAEGSALGIWLFQDFKNKKERIWVPYLNLHESCDFTGWQIGLQKAAAQNLARQLEELASNILTPSVFAQTAVEVLCKSGVNVEVKVKEWAEQMQMNGFLQVSKGSCEPPIFLELSYYGASNTEERPVVLIGKGMTFNSGGLELKNCKDMKYMRGDMSGASVVLATMRAIANLGLPINVRGLIPLAENMPGCSSMKPGDAYKSMGGKTVLIQSTDVSGRIMIADAISYAQTFWPIFILDVGTHTKTMRQIMGRSSSAVWTNSERMWRYIEAASMHTGDRVWRFPLWQHYAEAVTKFETVDLHTIGVDSGTGCKVAAFLYQFVPCGEWMHVDSQGVYHANDFDESYLRLGMSGRPTRTLIEFLSQLVCRAESECI